MTQFADIFANRPVLADGAMGTVLYARGIFINRCYDDLNLSDPGLILSIHEEYLQSGAEILETNTFGANRFRLARHGLAGKVAEINTAGVRLARQAQRVAAIVGVVNYRKHLGALARCENVGLVARDEDAR